MKDKKNIIIEDTIKNILPNNDRSKLINCNGDDFFKKKNTNNERMNMNTFKIKYYEQSTFRSGKANDSDHILNETVQLNLPSDATQMEICTSWQKENGSYRRVTFVSAKGDL